MATVSWKPQPQVAITLNDVRTLAVCLVRPADDLFYNWTSTGWETPFVAAAHLKPLQTMEAAPSLFSGVRYLDLGHILLDRSDVAALLLSTDASGNPIAVVDCWTLPSPTPNPVIGGFLR
jgi:hypothetical protein